MAAMQVHGEEYVERPAGRGERLWVHAGSMDGLGEAGLERLEHFLDPLSVAVRTERPLRSLYRLAIPGPDGPRDHYLKIHRRIGFRKVWEELADLRWPRSKGWAELENLLWFRSVGVDTAFPVAAGERKRFGIETISFLLTRTVAPYVTLWDRLDELGGARSTGDGFRAKRQLSRAVAAVIARLHRAGIVYPGFLAKHVFVEPGVGTEEVPRIRVLDLKKPLRMGRPLSRGPLRDLGHFLTSLGPRHVTRADRFRFARDYKEAGGPAGGETPRELIRALEGLIRRLAGRGVSRFLRFTEKRFPVPTSD